MGPGDTRHFLEVGSDFRAFLLHGERRDFVSQYGPRDSSAGKKKNKNVVRISSQQKLGSPPTSAITETNM